MQQYSDKKRNQVIATSMVHRSIEGESGDVEEIEFLSDKGEES